MTSKFLPLFSEKQQVAKLSTIIFKANMTKDRVRRMKEVMDTKVIVGESVAKQHRMVVSAIIIWTK